MKLYEYQNHRQLKMIHEWIYTYNKVTLPK
jgi:hypothetical protein